MHYRKNTIVCPHCDYEMNDDDMHNHDEDLFAIAPKEGRCVVECPNCDKEFWVEGSYMPQYTTAFAEEEL